MITSDKLRYSIVILLLVSACAAVLSFFSLPYQFYLWEFFLDARLLVLVAVSLTAWKRGWLSVAASEMTLLRFRTGMNILLFLGPLLFYIVPAAVGLYLKEVKIQAMDNAATLILATIFDIPAIFVFSVITIMAEEILFRGFLLRSFRAQYGPIKGTLVMTVVWALYCIPEVLSVPELTLNGGMVLFLYFYATGLISASFLIANGSLWSGYSFRVGITALTPIVLTSALTESDPFLATTSIFFGAEGIIVSMLFLLTALVLFRRFPRPAISARNQDFS